MKEQVHVGRRTEESTDCKFPAGTVIEKRKNNEVAVMTRSMTNASGVRKLGMIWPAHENKMA
jgi:hypothetical protein